MQNDMPLDAGNPPDDRAGAPMTDADRAVQEAAILAHNAAMLSQIPFGPWSPGWKGRLARWLIGLKERADEKIAARIVAQSKSQRLG